MRIIPRRLATLARPILLGASACLPYTVGSTAQTVPSGQTTSADSYYFIPNAFKHPGDSIGAPLAGVDREWRHGIDAQSDFGVRLTSGAGVVMNYKHRYRDYENGSPALAYMIGSGIVNGGQHMHLEATLIASGDERAGVTPFGGVRAMQVIPISAGAVNDSPTIGVFGGAQVGDASFTIRPELGVFYDHSALGVRTANFIIVPAVTIGRGRRHSELRQVEMQGTRNHPDARARAGILRCLLLSCPASSASTSIPQSTPGVMIVH